MSEAAYSRARRIELHDQGIQCQAETSIAVHYKGHVVCHQRLDLLVADELIVEVKSVEQIHPVHVAQVVSYLRAARKRAALLVNFNVPVLREGIRRIVL